ncbi:hypothetical protein N8940_02500, partial [Sphingomonadaceae bacterium]|nr:hypothetical protein [Sphingomonadaceae bacterium]
TSSGADTGGRITIANPFLILSEGGSILALGEQGGANVQIRSSFFIRSSDTINLLSVDGSLVLDSQIGDQITGTEPVDISFIDASGILSGQCTASSSGRTSRFSSQITGPYAPLKSLEAAPEETPETDSPQTDGEDSPDTVAALQTLAPCS